MTYNTNGTRFRYDYTWENVKNSPYDYEKHGLLKHLMSNRIINTTNTPLKIIIQFFETSLIFLMRYIDELKNFKNPYWKNR